MVVSEALRKWPSFRITSRECTKEYTLKDEDTGRSYVIAKGTEILLPIGAIQNDPKYFADPEKFDPNRFSDENKANIESGSYIPFGFGPRMCIGRRFAELEIEVLTIRLIREFELGWDHPDLKFKSLTFNTPADPLRFKVTDTKV